MIPLLGVPILNREDLAARMVESIDYPVGELLVVANARDKAPIIVALGKAADANPYVTGIRFSSPSFNLGCGGSWNHIIRHRPAGPWWLIVNADIVFGAGDLERLASRMDGDGRPAFATLFEFGAFALNTACVDSVGWFDENLHPMYFEDNDYQRRMFLAGVEYEQMPSGTTHDTSSTIRSDPSLAARNDVTFKANAAYYLEKWGGPPRQERFGMPFGRGQERPVSRRRLAEQGW